MFLGGLSLAWQVRVRAAGGFSSLLEGLHLLEQVPKINAKETTISIAHLFQTRLLASCKAATNCRHLLEHPLLDCHLSLI